MPVQLHDNNRKFSQPFRLNVSGEKASASASPARKSPQRTGGPPLGKRVTQSLAGILGVTLLTLLLFRFHFAFAFASPLYLLLVLLFSLAGDFYSSVVISVAAAVCLDYFFVDPLFSFRVSSPVNVLSLTSFLVTALVVTRLVSRVREEASLAKLQKERLDSLYRLAQQLLALEPEKAVGRTALAPFEGVLGLTAVCAFDPQTAELNVVGTSQGALADRTREAYFFGQDIDDRALGISVRRIQVRGQVTGTVGFEGLEDPELTAGPLVALAATLLERIRAFRAASESASAVKVETYRSAVLDALAHEFKTPLATILTAAGGLREAGPLRAEQLEMAETVELEASRLASLASQLLHIAKLDREEVHPRMEAMNLAPLIVQTVDQYLRLPSDRRISLESHDDLSEVVGDPELLRLAVSQLLDNACKYSLPGSTISVQIRQQPDFSTVSVSNNGSSIPFGEQHRIFERFYRGAEARRFTSGSGLGLYVARKIALAHGGSLELDSDSSTTGRVTFGLSIPRVKGESDRAAAVQ